MAGREGLDRGQQPPLPRVVVHHGVEGDRGVQALPGAGAPPASRVRFGTSGVVQDRDERPGGRGQHGQLVQVSRLRVSARVDGVQQDVGVERGPHRGGLEPQVLFVGRGRRREEAVEQRPRIVVAVGSGGLDRVPQPIRLLEPRRVEQNGDRALVVGHLARFHRARRSAAGAHLAEVAAPQQGLKQ